MLESAQPRSMYKIGKGAPEDQPWMYQNVWASEDLSGTERLIIAPRTDYIGLIEILLDVMPEPIWLLYLLVVPRGESKAGRYQNTEPQSREQVRRFLSEFGEFLENDGRQCLWMRSEFGGAMLVYDRHNLIYAYGHLTEWAAILTRAGLNEVAPELIAVPNPHSHHYHAAFDSEAERLLSFLDWDRTPLLEQDKR